ncbi:HDOD domain-containing protein [Beggiatoa alba]|nr:HDOD domain-containing protein [Beggiatoa alba]
MQEMSTNTIVKALLDALRIPYENIECPDSITMTENWVRQAVPAEHQVRVVLMREAKVSVIAMIPSNHQLDLKKLTSLLKRQPIRFLDIKEHKKFIHHIVSKPRQLHRQMGVQLIIDEALTNLDTVYFESPVSAEIIKLDAGYLESLASDALLGCTFSEQRVSAQKTADPNSTQQFNIKERLNKIQQLPPMPELVVRLLRLRNNRHARVEQLAEIIVLDPAISAQVIRYANSPFFGRYRQVKSLYDAIFRVLGYESVIHLALGVAIGKVFRLPMGGPVGQSRIWKNATYSAALCQKLATKIHWDKRLQPGIAYLCALLHNIGFMVIGQLFKHEFIWLNKVIQAEHGSPITLIETKLLGISHTEVAAIIMKQWQMPEEVITAAQQHHNDEYDGEHAGYVKLVQIADRLLKNHDMSDAASEEIPTELYDYFDITEEQLYEAMDEILQGKEDLDAMIMSMTA